MANSYLTMISNGRCNIFSRYVDDIFIIILVLICKKDGNRMFHNIHFISIIYKTCIIYICKIQHISFSLQHISVGDNCAIV